MEVRSDRRHRFPVSPDELWPAMTRVGDYREWWPWLSAFDGSGFDAGAQWECVVQPPLPYSVRFRVTLEHVVPAALVIASVDGDIIGSARLEITAVADGSEARLMSRLAPKSRLLRVVAGTARPVARFGHDWVLDTGLRQFAARAL